MVRTAHPTSTKTLNLLTLGLTLNSSEMAGAMAKTLIEDMERHAFLLEWHIDEESYEQNIWHGYENE